MLMLDSVCILYNGSCSIQWRSQDPINQTYEIVCISRLLFFRWRNVQVVLDKSLLFYNVLLLLLPSC